MRCHGCFKALALIMAFGKKKEEEARKNHTNFNELNESKMKNKLKAFHKL